MVNLRTKNKALLAKWRWRFMIDKNAMWYKMSFAKYGSNVARWRFSANNLKDMSKVWRGIVENSLDASVVRWLGDKNFSWKIGNGKTTLFWEDKWCGKDSLKVDFPRLFRLAKLKYASVFDYSSYYGFSNVNWEDIFVRPLLDREMGILSRLIDGVTPMNTGKKTDKEIIVTFDDAIGEGEWNKRLL